MSSKELKTLGAIFHRMEEILATPDTWIKGQAVGLKKGQECYCLIGAARVALGMSADGYAFWAHQDSAKKGRAFVKIADCLMKAIRLYDPNTKATSAEQFNDRQRTRHSDILGVLTLAKKIGGRKSAYQ